MRLGKDLLRAIAYAYVWVSFSDGEFAHSEWASFQRHVSTGKYQPRISEVELKEVYDEVIGGFVSDYEGGCSSAVKAMTSFGTHQESADAILEVAQYALLIDGKMRPQEDSALTQIQEIFQK